MAKDKNIQMCLWAVLGMIVVVMWPICVYSLYILRTNWEQAYFIKRRRKAIFLMLILCCFALFVSMPGTTVVNLIYDHYESAPAHVLLPFLAPTKYILFVCTMLVMTRVWLYYYDINYAKEMSAKEWRVLINDCVASNEYLWFSAHRKQYGCHNYCLRRVLGLGAIMVGPYCYMHIDYGYGADIYGSSIFSALITITGLIWCKYPKFNDTLGIRDELRKILIVWALCLLIAECGVIYQYIKRDFAACGVMAMFVISLNLGSIVYFTIIDVYRQHKDDDDLQTSYSKHLSMHSRSSNYENVNVRSWKPIVSKINGYELFMDHLQKEFSIENLLFLTEYAQFKTALFEFYPTQMQQLMNELPWELMLPPSDKVPISCIVYRFKNEIQNNGECTNKPTNDSNGNTDDGDDIDDNPYAPFLNACLKLYEKYIKAGEAPFEVNISSLKRYAIAQIFENQKETIINRPETLQTVLLRFESSVLAIEALMNDSFSRFKRTEIAKEFWTRFMTDDK